jgi:hypothetical protein
LLLAAAMLAMISHASRAAEAACDYCGCSTCVKRVCVPKMIEKEIIKVCWDYKCEDVCIPGPSTKCGVKCNEDECGCWSFEIWKPNCARVKTRHIPVKTVVKRKVPAVEWVVEHRCQACCHRCDQESSAAPPAAVPPVLDRVAPDQSKPDQVDRR